jgi:hypothetical protein
MLVAVAVIAVVLVLAAVTGLVRGRAAYPFGLSDSQHWLVLKPGRTVPGRSVDAAGTGCKYHFTRYDSYRIPDWHPKS